MTNRLNPTNDPLLAEAIERVQQEVRSPMEFDFVKMRNTLNEGNTDVVRTILNSELDTPEYLTQTATRGNEIALALIRALEEQHATHPITPSELAVAMQLLLVGSLTSVPRATPVRMMMQSIAVAHGILDPIFRICAMTETLTHKVKRETPKPDNGDQG